MNKLIALLFSITLFLGIIALPAQSHSGSCYNTPKRSLQGGYIQYSNQYNCNGYPHNITVVARLERRPPGGTWNLVAQVSASQQNVPAWNVVGTFPYDCSKQYRTVGSGAASPGGHNSASISSTLNNTC